MRIRIKVYDTEGQVYNRLDLSAADESYISELVQDIDEFLREQYAELKEEGEEGDDE